MYPKKALTANFSNLGQFILCASQRISGSTSWLQVKLAVFRVCISINESIEAKYQSILWCFSFYKLLFDSWPDQMQYPILPILPSRHIA